MVQLADLHFSKCYPKTTYYARDRGRVRHKVTEDPYHLGIDKLDHRSPQLEQECP